MLVWRYRYSIRHIAWLTWQRWTLSDEPQDIPAHTCPDAPWMLPTDGILGVLWGDARVPRDAGTASQEALLALLDRDLERAEEILAAVVRRDSEATWSYLALARLWRERGEVGRAIRLHQNLCLRLDPASALGRAALLDLAADFRQGGFLRRALAAYEELLERDPRCVAALRGARWASAPSATTTRKDTRRTGTSMAGMGTMS